MFVVFCIFDCLYDVRVSRDAFEDCMFVVELGCGDGGDEKLWFVGIWVGICYGYGEWLIVV